MNNLEYLPTDFSTVDDFIYYDGIGYISHIRDNNNTDYFSIFAERKEEFDIYLLIKTDIETIKLYLKGLKTLHSIITENTSSFYLAKVSDNIEIEIISFDKIDKDWIPSENAFFNGGIPEYYKNL